jgi:cytochrome P450
MSDDEVITVAGYEAARDAFRQRDLRQALYDEGEVVMADVLVNLHGDEHRARRRLENRLFRREVHERYEHDLFPPIVAETLAPHVAAGRAELVGLSHQLMMNLAASAAGVDRPEGTPEETHRLYRHLMTFIAGATLAHHDGDRDALRAEVARSLDVFDEEFLAASVARRRTAIARVEAGGAAADELPRDVLTVLLQNHDDLRLPPEVVRRETCFYLLAGAHTSATAFVRTLDHLFTRGIEPGDAEDLDLLQRCVHETVRLQPSSPIAMRRAVADVTLADGRSVPEGATVVIDLVAANRDPAVFGDRADVFDPDRTLPTGIAPWGLSFGLGMHACIGQRMAAGGDPATTPAEEDPLHGLVPVALQAVLRAGVRPAPDDAPHLDPTSARGYWDRYPVVFAAGSGAP